MLVGNSVEVFLLGYEDSGPIDVFSEFWIYHVNVTQGMGMASSETRYQCSKSFIFETGSTSRLDAN